MLAAERRRGEQADDQQADAQEVERALSGQSVVERELPVEERPLDVRVQRVGQQMAAEPVVRVEDVVLHRERERERRDGQVEPLDPDGRQADDDRRDRTGGDADRERGEEVDVVLGDQSAGAGGADTDEAELAERDLPRPAGQHDERDTDDAVDRQDLQFRDVVVAGDERQHDRQGKQGADAECPRADYLGHRAQLERDRPEVRDRLPARRVLVDRA